MAKINTNPVSGTRDFLPLEVLRRHYVIDIVERVYQRYGFEPLETPTMERLDTLLGKYGEEGDQLIFRVLKRGEKLNRVLESQTDKRELADSGLRYDLTVPLARVAAEYRAQLPRFFKRYQIQPVFRADRPAKGRFREFFQCDLDVVGTKSLIVEVELLSAAVEVLNELGFGQADFKLRLNHRALLRGLIQAAGIDPALEEPSLVAIDKLDKIGIAGVEKELLNRGVSSSSARRLLKLAAGSPESNNQTIDWLREALATIEIGLRGLSDLERIIQLLQGSPAAPFVEVDPFLARGLSYYTGPIFEVALIDATGSAGGGGRYDGLVGMFSGQELPACGFSLGLERVLLVMDEKGLFPSRLAGQPQVLMTQFSEETIPASMSLARDLRRKGLRVDLYPEPTRYGRQFKYADQRQIRFALLLSEREMEEGVVTVKDLKSGNQEEVAPEKIPAWIGRRENSF